MAKRPNVTSIRSKQNQVLRYVVSTDVDKTAKDLNVSTEKLQRFLRSKPETIKKNPTPSKKLLEANPTKVAKEEDVKLVQRLSGKRLGLAYKKYSESDRTARAIRYSQATRRRKRITEGESVRFVVLDETKGKIARKQILENMGGTTAKSIMTQYNRGDISEDETKFLLKKLWRNSGVPESGANVYFEKNG